MKLFRKLTREILKITYYISVFFVDNIIQARNSRKFYGEIILVKLDNIGDFIIWITFAKAIKTFYKKEKITLVCHKNVKDLALKLNLFDKIIEIDQTLFCRNLIYRIRKIKVLKEYSYGKVFHSTFSRSFICSDSIVRILCARKKYGFCGDTKNQSKFLKMISNLWYTNLFSSKEILIHEYYRNNEFLRKLKIPNIKNKSIPIISELKNINLTLPKDFIIVNPGASDHSRMWPVANFINLINKILKSKNIVIYICGSNNDKDIGKKIKENIPNKNLINITGKTSIIELIELIRLSKLVIANDSASVHIANAVETNSICISGGNNFGRFVPYPKEFKYAPKTIYDKDCLKNNWSCFEENNCINKVSEDVVFREVIKKLNL